MKKKGLVISLVGVMVAASSSALLFLNQNAGAYAFADADCDGFHYSEVTPTFEESGHREYWICCKHANEIFFTEPESGHWEDHTDEQMIGGFDETHPAYLPALNDADYTRKFSESNNVLTEKWTYVDPNATGSAAYSTSLTYNYGYAKIVNYDVSDSEVTYSLYDFNYKKVFDGLELDINESTNTVTLDVKKTGGYVFNNTAITFYSYKGYNKFILTGEPLTMYGAEGKSKDVISFYGAGTTDSTVMDTFIENELSIIYPTTYTTPSTGFGLYERKLTVGADAKLTIKGFKNGIKQGHSMKLNVNGLLDITSIGDVLVSTGSNARTMQISSGLAFYFDDVVQVDETSGAYITSTTSAIMASKGVRHLEVKAAA